MTAISEFLSNIDNQKKIFDGMTKRKQAVEDYSPKEWSGAKKELWKLTFPDNRFEDITSKKIELGESHEVGKETHALQVYYVEDKLNGFNLMWRYSFCPACRKIINKYGVLTNEIENLAFIKRFVRNGEIVIDNEKKAEKKAEKKVTNKMTLDEAYSLLTH